MVLVYAGVLQNSLVRSLRVIEELLGVGADDHFAQQLPAWVEKVSEERIIPHDVGEARQDLLIVESSISK